MSHNNNYYKPYQCLLTLLIVLLLRSTPASAAPTDAELLLKFKSSLSNAAALSDWNASVPLCNGNKNNWSGLTCMNGNLYGLRLENMGLMGVIDVETLSQLSSDLRSLSVMYNSFTGAIPPVGRLGGLRALFLSHSGFSGKIPHDAFEGMKYLKKVYLARNGFGGRLPSSLVGLSKLVELDVEGNQLGGKIPGFEQRDWRVLNFANNRFKGRIPASLSKIDRSAFLGNPDLCGAPLSACKPPKKPFITIAIVLSIAAIIATIALFIFFLRARRAQSPNRKSISKHLGQAPKVYKKFALWDTARSPDYYDDKKKGDRNRSLHFVRNDRERFELEDLLRASAEVLGSGSFGSSYKAVLFSGQALVVKRFRYMNNVGREELHAHMARLGRLSHPNLLPLVAYYYTKEEKLLISDFVENGSLASRLHGKRPAGEQGLDWPTRLNIVKGVSRGLSYLYREFPNLTLPHGHLKSSNVLLDRGFNPLLSEYALTPLLNITHAHQFMAAFKSPEFSHRDRASKKTDVWSLGILILELLTGKFPANYLKRGTADLAAWVNSVVREEWTGEVFDKEMCGTRRGEGEMLKLLKIGLCCCEASSERRWDWRQASEKIEELMERDNDGEDYSSYVTDWDVYSSMVLSDEDFSFSVKN
ncbi:putative LRR receptor-like serine/threonine-protein kinase [Morus notabilis]|uniref:Putative LRR receptor-like serine/threonine-protein kinase n=1 Tax=Morus notabilis TaxID=981085 RepID=W9SHU2_9ROSA|nr:probable LRR receptor-like serine/threonine-protein kinase At4g31250 [Morus notabilis]EXC32752.1 putative LRR receptor-like serine/threonine-protein kinase [Morus notabilis]